MKKKYTLNAIQIAEIIHSCTSRIPRIDGSFVDVWSDLTELQKEHATQAVREIYSAPKKTPEELHNLWMKPLIENGWTKGDYNFEKKQHPSIIPFNELPESEILKDELWAALTECFRKYYNCEKD